MEKDSSTEDNQWCQCEDSVREFRMEIDGSGVDCRRCGLPVEKLVKIGEHVSLLKQQAQLDSLTANRVKMENDKLQKLVKQLENALIKKTEECDQLTKDLHNMSGKLVREIDLRGQLQVEKDKVQEEVEELTRNLFEQANGMVADESRKRHEEQQKRQTIETEFGKIVNKYEKERRIGVSLRRKISDINVFNTTADVLQQSRSEVTQSLSIKVDGLYKLDTFAALGLDSMTDARMLVDFQTFVELCHKHADILDFTPYKLAQLSQFIKFAMDEFVEPALRITGGAFAGGKLSWKKLLDGIVNETLAMELVDYSDEEHHPDKLSELVKSQQQQQQIKTSINQKVSQSVGHTPQASISWPKRSGSALGLVDAQQNQQIQQSQQQQQQQSQHRTPSPARLWQSFLNSQSSSTKELTTQAVTQVTPGGVNDCTVCAACGRKQDHSDDNVPIVYSLNPKRCTYRLTLIQPTSSASAAASAIQSVLSSSFGSSKMLSGSNSTTTTANIKDSDSERVRNRAGTDSSQDSSSHINNNASQRLSSTGGQNAEHSDQKKDQIEVKYYIDDWCHDRILAVQKWWQVISKVRQMCHEHLDEASEHLKQKMDDGVNKTKHISLIVSSDDDGGSNAYQDVFDGYQSPMQPKHNSEIPVYTQKSSVKSSSSASKKKEVDRLFLDCLQSLKLIFYSRIGVLSFYLRSQNDTLSPVSTSNDNVIVIDNKINSDDQ
ncbi:hypothetical protein MP228_008324 [Amoeboaphelidium protococcarum]|nr:hypothetical protein MP228_008324 [Amoeboaphelidium protococcarum]